MEMVTAKRIAYLLKPCEWATFAWLRYNMVGAATVKRVLIGPHASEFPRERPPAATATRR